MFRLRKHIRRHKDRVGIFIRNDHDLGGTGDHVDRHGAVSALLRRRHISIAGADQFFHFPDRCRAVTEGSHSVRATQFIDLGCARRFEGIQGRGVDFSILHGRGRRHDLFHTGCRRDPDSMDRCGDQRSRTARHIATHPVHGQEPFPLNHAGTGRKTPVRRQSFEGKRPDMLQSIGDRPFHFGIDRLFRFSDLGFRNEKFRRSQRHSVKFFQIAADRFIAIRLNVVHDLRNGFFHCSRSRRSFVKSGEQFRAQRVIAKYCLHFVLP